MSEVKINKEQGGKRGIEKVPTGIKGLDEITLGGLPKGRPTLICGNAGCGKTVLSMEFLINGAVQFNEPGLFVSFEENEEELKSNFLNFGKGLDGLIKQKKILIDYVYIERDEIQETGEYDLEGLFVRIRHALNSIGAKRIVLDTIESLFSGFSNEAILRAELRRLFRWLKSKNLSAIITGERGNNLITRHGLEEYVADCVMLLDHEVNNKIATRRLRIVKYRGTPHGTNEYPFLICEDGISILPITSLGLAHKAGVERVSTGIAELDNMLGAKGYYRGSNILVSGSPGSGKTSIAAAFLYAACLRGEKCLFFSFEESRAQIIRNMNSIGMDFGKWIKKGVLEIESARPSLNGIEMHLAFIHKKINEYNPKFIVLDPISDFAIVGSPSEIKSMLSRLVDFLKTHNITALFTDIMPAGKITEHNESGVSSLADTWIVVSNEAGRELRDRSLSIIKSRGMDHSDKVVKLSMSDKGIKLQI